MFTILFFRYFIYEVLFMDESFSIYLSQFEMFSDCSMVYSILHLKQIGFFWARFFVVIVVAFVVFLFCFCFAINLTFGNGCQKKTLKPKINE